MHQKKISFFFLLLLCFSTAIYSQSRQFPQITDLSSRNVVFKQYIQQVESSYKEIAQVRSPTLHMYEYKAKQGDTLIRLAARCNLPYETLATLNRITSTDMHIVGKTLLLPTAPGLFVAKKPQTEFEYALSRRTLDFSKYTCYILNDSEFYFMLGERLSRTERAFFLDTGMSLPLANGILTSGYGLRESPISGNMSFHEGIDLAAPAGTPVLAAKSGAVRRVGVDYIYGNYIVITHENGTDSFYAHLESIIVKEEEPVARGQTIGFVGSTGLSTGPHVHFELRVKGESINPNSIF